MLIPLFDFKGFFFFFLHFLILIIKGSQPFSMETVYQTNLFERQVGIEEVAKAFPYFYSETGKNPFFLYSSSVFILRGQNEVY